MPIFAYFPPSWLVLGFINLAVIYGICKGLIFLVKPLLSPLRDLPGPKSPSLLYGHIMQIFRAEPGELHAKWIEEYGPTFTYKRFFNQDRLMTLDTKALAHILNHSYDWQKPAEISTSLARLLGEGILFAEGDSHKRQRRIMNPSFSLSHLRELTPIFLEKSAQLRDIWLAHSTEGGGSYQTDVLAWLNKATLDIIGLAGFDYEFNALNPSGIKNELNDAFVTVTKQSQRITILGILQALVPQLQFIPTNSNRSIAKARKVMDRIGRQLVDEKKRTIFAAAGVKNNGPEASKIERNFITARDILSRLMSANLATDLSESQRLADKDVFAQIPTFLVAGHETTSSATTWCLYALACDLDVQKRLREELLSIATSMPSMEELNSLPYLDAVVRETLRLHAVVSMTARIATKDDVIPLETPFKDKHGVMRHEIRVNKGESIVIPILSLNTYKGIWGEDANEFRPDRWKHLPQKAGDIPGVLPGLLSFIGGPRSCIGYRFALIEMKCIIWTLVRGFTFEFADPSHRDGISKKTNIVTRPVVKSEAEKGSQLPLKLTPWRAA